MGHDLSTSDHPGMLDVLADHALREPAQRPAEQAPDDDPAHPGAEQPAEPDVGQGRTVDPPARLRVLAHLGRAVSRQAQAEAEAAARAGANYPRLRRRGGSAGRAPAGAGRAWSSPRSLPAVLFPPAITGAMT
ncbi:hypothetical protein [Streptomyces cyaneofuscatus]|uniref:hypothetical protein n=1 Tax=Streptomyces cyaneofuscatus TaxID=66883 RepID=UPI00364F9FFA